MATSPLMVERTIPEDLSPILREASRIEESCKVSAQNQFEQAKRWQRTNTLLGIPSAALAAVAGATGLTVATGRVPASLLALLAGAVGAVNATLNLGRRIEQAHSVANGYLSLQQDARIMREIDLLALSYDDARQRLTELVGRQQELNGTAPIPSRRLYKRAQRNIEEGGQTYEVDR